ncbi:MAG: ubiquinone/menaquinone biosynthesis methyltransferase [Gemmatimonadetes bacterium]|nr:ubiquinone/menaquinone biosynthesis methyltransferase [Gemmatimonadota bacterium]
MPTPHVPSARALDELDVAAIVRDPERKQAFVTPMFEHIAPRYDAFTRWFSFGMDAAWKRELLALVQGQPSRVADLACGTGDLAFAVAAAHPSAEVLGIDAATGMIEQARARGGQRAGLRFDVGDLTHLAVPDASLDALTAGYAFRNVPDLTAALREAHRVLRAGGWLYTLDFYRPAARPWRRAFLTYLHLAGSAFGWWWHRAPVIYSYIATSIDAWVTVAEWESALDAAGFAVASRRTYLLGGVALHAAQRR